ncbi:MAG TPA: AsmA-like C-terminal region-containing protein [Burkholderiales bacterium]|nr:AsmA-like C-terminal region-containing protein [Burkholderiales bacterium]
MALALVLALPMLLDQPRMRATLQARVSTLLHGTTTWGGLQLRLLPAPHGAFEQLRVEIPGILTVRAGRLEARLRLWPLLRGKIEVASLTAVDAQVRLELATGRVAARPDAAAQGLDPVAPFRQAAGAAARAIQESAPDLQLAIQGGALELRLQGLPPLELRALDLRAHATGARVDLRLTAASEYWRRLSLEADFDVTSQSGQASLDVEALNPHAWVERALRSTGVRLAIAPLGVRASLKTDGADALSGRLEARTRSVRVSQGARAFELPGVALKTAARSDAQGVQVQLDELLLDGSKLLEGNLAYAYASRETAGRFAFDLDAARMLELVRRALASDASGDAIESASGRLRGGAHLAVQGGHWRAGLQLRDADASFQLRRLPWPVRLRSGRAEWVPGLVSASAIQAGLGRSSVADFAARLRLHEAWRLDSASGRASLDLDQLYPWAREQPALREALRDVPAVQGELGVELLKASGRPASPDFEARLVPRGVRIQADALPGMLSVDGGAARITRTTAELQQLRLGMLDAKATVSGSVTGIATRDFRVRLQLAEGSAGTDAVAWALAQAQAPSQLALRTPFAFEAERLDWGPGRRLESSARIRFDADTGAAMEQSWQPGTFDLRRLDVHSRQGKSAFAVRAEGRQVSGRFSGTLHSAVLAYFLRDAGRYSGRIAGDLRFAADPGRLGHASAEGRLNGEGLDLTWLAGRPVLVEKFAIEADGNALRMGEVLVRAGEDSATLRGELRRGEHGPIVDASIESEGIVLDRLLALVAADGPRTAGALPAKPRGGSPAEAQAAAAVERDFAHWWPLPITGRVALRAGFIQQGSYRAAPVNLVVSLEAERARLDVEHAQLCGIALPFTVEARREAWSAAARIAAPRQSVNEMARCLTGEHVQITGDADFLFDLKTQGRGRDLLRNLEGTGRIETRDGRIQKFALIANILSLLDIKDTVQAAEDIAEGAQGFRYRRIAAAGRVRDGQFLLDEGVFESPSAGMAANGTVRLADGDTRMTVLVAPFGRVDRLVRGIPVIGYVVGGTLTSIPVSVSGDIRSPLVVPLGPRAVTQELLGIFERTLKLPTKLVDPDLRQ